MVLYQICVFGADLKFNMAARVHNMFSLAEILKIFLSETTNFLHASTNKNSLILINIDDPCLILSKPGYMKKKFYSKLT
jgi:hypothetical protein